MNLKEFKIKDLLQTYLTSEAGCKKSLKKETTTTGDIALPDDKAETDTPAGRKKKKKKKEKLILGKDGEPKKGKSG